MSLGIAFKGPEGIVLAADSRVTLNAQAPGGPAVAAYFDNATKLLRLKTQPSVGIITYGLGALGQQQPRTAHSFLPELEAVVAAKHGLEQAPVREVAEDVLEFYANQWRQAGMPEQLGGLQPMTFLVGGFDPGDAYGRIYEIAVPTSTAPTELAPGEFGVTFGGQAELASRLLAGVDPKALLLAREELNLTQDQTDALAQRWRTELGLPIPYQFLPLQDCVDLATFLVYMTSTTQGWTVAIRGVGGAVDVATITRVEGFQPVSQKTIDAWGPR